MVQDNNTETIRFNSIDGEEMEALRLVPKQLDGYTWFVDEPTGEVYGLVGEEPTYEPIGKMSIKSNFTRWLQIPYLLEENGTYNWDDFSNQFIKTMTD